MSCGWRFSLPFEDSRREGRDAEWMMDIPDPKIEICGGETERISCSWIELRLEKDLV